MLEKIIDYMSSNHGLYLIAGVGIGLLLAAVIVDLLEWLAYIRAEKSHLQERETYLDAIIENVPLMIIIKEEKELRFVRLNKAAEEITGIPREAMLGKNDLDFFPKAQAEFFMNTDRDVLASDGLKIVGRELLDTPNGQRILFTKKKSIQLPDKRRFLICIAEDITERTRQEERTQKIISQLAESNTLNEAILASTAYLIIATDNTGTITLFNAAAEAALGYKSKEIVGKQTPAIWHDNEEVEKRAQELSEELGRPVEPGLDVFTIKPLLNGRETREWTFIRKDGTRFPVNLAATPLRNADGEVTGYLAVIEDITAQKEDERDRALIEESLMVSEQRHRLLVDGVIDYAIFWLDIHGRINSWNKGARNLKGYTEQEVIGKHFSMFFTDEDRADNLPEKSLETAAEKGKYEAEGYRVRKDGSRFWAHVIIEPIYDSLGEIIGFAKISHDETTRKQHEILQQAVMDKLIASNTELERFAYIASHDMQEPIRMVTNFSTIISRDYGDKLDDTGREYLKLLVDSGMRMHELVEDLLAYSRLANEGVKFTTFSGEKVVDGVLENLKELIRENKVQITRDPLPELYGNPVQIGRLVQNLLTNSIKYQPENGFPQLHIGFEEMDEEYCIFVKDNGIGIKEEFIDKIFLPFRRLHTWEQISGTGLGLSICKKVAENHGGRIWATSTYGEGATFHFTIPRRTGE